MIDLILLTAGLPNINDQVLMEEVQGKPMYRHSFETVRQSADAMLGLRVIVVTRSGALEEAVREFGFNKVVVPEHCSLSQAIIAGAKAARPGASRCFLPCNQLWVSGEMLIGFLQGYILSGRSLGRASKQDQSKGPMVFAPYLLPSLMTLKGDEDGSALFQGREARTFDYSLPEERKDVAAEEK